jgi:ribonuclease VapC
MVIDTSAVLAWLKNEPERNRIVTALERYSICRISAVSVLEAHIVIQAREHPDMIEKLQRFLQEIEAITVPFDDQQAHIAYKAFKRYGKGQGHPAQLNFGDCAVYALASVLDEPLLFIGNDFSQTDLKFALE